MAGFVHLWRLMCVCAAVLLSSCTPAAERGPVILAPASMQEAMEGVADAWEAQGHPRPVLSIAGTPAIARQAAEGAPADIIITADNEWMDWLEGQGLLLEGSRAVLLSNRLVLVRSDHAPPDLQMTDRQARIAMGDPDSVPAGRYAKALLVAQGQWDALAKRIVPTENVRAALALAERGEADFAFVYGSDLVGGSGSLAIVQSWSDIAGAAITYPLARLRGSTHGEGEALYRFLRSSEVSALLRQHGFGPAEGGA